MVDEIIEHNLIQYYMLMKMIFLQKMLELDDHHGWLAKEIEYPWVKIKIKIIKIIIRNLFLLYQMTLIKIDIHQNNMQQLI